MRDRLKNVLKNDFVRMTYTELVELVRKHAKEGKVRRSKLLYLPTIREAVHVTYIPTNMDERDVDGGFLIAG